MSEPERTLNDAEVDFLIDGADAVASPPVPAPADPSETAVTMRGDLDQINLSDIFQTLGMTKMEGVLRVRNPLELRQIYCNEGHVRILVPARIATQRLGQRLVKAGLVQPEQLRSALLRQRREPGPIGALLVADGLVTQAQVDEIAGMQVAEDLFALFTWRHGTFEFYKGPVAEPELQKQFETCPEFEVTSLLLEVARRSDEWQCILEVLSSLDEVPARIADVPADRELAEVERSLLFGADGRLTYRQLAEQTTSGLFEVARAGRDLVRSGCLANVGDDELIAVAESYAESAQPKQALMLLQTLRDRSGTRSLATLSRMVSVLDKAGERRLAGTMLLEIAQQQTSAEVALPLARRARDLAPTDPATISFLRTTLLVHTPVDSSEVELITLDLLDALLAIDKFDTALEIVAEARQLGSASVQVMAREARLRQKARDTQGAIKVLFELGEIYRAQGDKKRAIEAYAALVRLDRSRKDVQKLLRQMRQTRTDRIVRSAAAAVAACLLGAMGVVLWQQNSFDTAVRTAASEVGDLLRSGDRAAARESLENWAEVLGEAEAMEDLRRQVEFADASELTRQTKLARKSMQERLAQAADTLSAGDLRGALLAYGELAHRPDFLGEVTEVATTRIAAILVEIDLAAKAMTSGLPAEPNTLVERQDLIANFASLQAMCPAALFRKHGDLRALHDRSALPSFLASATISQIAAILASTREVFDRAKELSVAYSAALQQKETERRLDPLFKKAERFEADYNFAGALDLYREIGESEAGTAEMRTHFRERVTRNAQICGRLEIIKKATEAGDFATAQQNYRALRESFAEVPFDRIVRLPLAVESLPSGAVVHCNGQEVGKTPCTLAFLPADNNDLSLTLAGFQPQTATITGDEKGRVHCNLLLAPQLLRQTDNRIEAAPAVDQRGIFYFADRGGVITAIDPVDGHELWAHRTNDLSGLLSQPFVHGERVIVASIDGDLRGIDRASGNVDWTLPDLPTEVGPVLVDNQLVIATTTRRLAAIDLMTRAVASTELPGPSRGALLAHGSMIFCCGDNEIVAHVLPSLARAWRRPLPDFGETSWTLAQDMLVITDDRGHVAALDMKSGQQIWRRQVDAETLGAPIVVDGEVLVGSTRNIQRFALADGAERTAMTMGSEELAGPPRLVGTRLLCPTRHGFVQVFDLASGRALYGIEGHKRGVLLLVVGRTVVVALPDRRVQFYGSLR